MGVLSQPSAVGHAWRQCPGQEDAPTADLAFVMRYQPPQNVSSHINKTCSLWVSKGAGKLLELPPSPNEVENGSDDPKWVFQ